jgi:diguanylate cyclase (GGDEF)-like protein
MIKRAARLLKHAFRSEDVVARLGGDEFGVIWTGSDEAKTEDAMKRIEHLLSVHNLETEGPPLRFSIGFSTGEKGAKCSGLLKEADRFMYEQKRLKKSPHSAVDLKNEKYAVKSPGTWTRL